VEYVEVVPYKADHYGTFSGAAGRLPVGLTVSSKPSLLEVLDELVAESLTIDAKLRAAGITLPYAGEDLLDHAAELLAAANVLERLIIRREPSPEKVGTAQVWRTQAHEILTAITSGRATATTSSGAAGISNAEPLTIDDIG
jgi:hypothetical protein